MEHVPKIKIFGLKMMVKRGLEKIIKKFSMPKIIAINFTHIPFEQVN